MTYFRNPETIIQERQKVEPKPNKKKVRYQIMYTGNGISHPVGFRHRLVGYHKARRITKRLRRAGVDAWFDKVTI